MDAGLTAPVAARRRRLREETRHILVGAGVVLLVALLFLFTTRTDRSALGSYRITARFNSVEGIFLDSPVRLAGVRIGRVVGLDYDSDRHQAIVMMAIRPEVELPADSLAIVTSEGMMGDRFMRIDPGGAMDMLRDGDEIEYTQDSILFEELLAKVITTVERQRRERKEGAAGEGAAESGQ